MATYDEKVLQKYADELYRQARVIIVWCALRGAVIGAIVGAAAAYGFALADRGEVPDPVSLIHNAAWLCGGIGLILGIARGLSKAFELKLEAQRVLCQMQIERNTRSEAQSLSVTGGPRSG